MYFTPVCTTEIIAFAKANTYFEKNNTCLIGLSIDSNASHMAWLYDIYCRTGIVVPFPIIADRSGEIARKYGMISNCVNSTSTLRNVFIISPDQKIKTILIYPMNIGRNIPEILRTVKALQIADENNMLTPANWLPCEPVIMPAPNNFSKLQERVNSKNANMFSWYLTLQKPPKCCIDEKNRETLPNQNKTKELK